MSGGAVPDQPGIEVRLAWLGVIAAAADIGSVYLKGPLGRPGVTVADWVEAAGTFIALWIYAWVANALAARAGRAVSLSLGTAFLVAASAYALGRGIHLAANSIHDGLAAAAAPDPMGLADWWDEHVGHHLVDLARIAFAITLTRWEAKAGPAGAGLRSTGQGPDGRPGAGRSIALGLGALTYGFIYFAVAVEGQTSHLALPFTVGYAGWGIATMRRSAAGPIRRFYTLSSLISLLFFLVWWIWQGGLPEFTRAGLLGAAP